MHKTKTILAAAILGLIAFAGNSQGQTASPSPVASPTPDPRAGTYNDPTLSIPQRLQLADAVLSGSDPVAVGAAADFMLYARPVIYLLRAYPGFADQVIADPTLSGTISDPVTIGNLYVQAIHWKSDTIPVASARAAYLAPLISSTLFDASQSTYAQELYATAVGWAANDQYNAGDYAGAIATAAPVLGIRVPQAITITFHSKIALRSPDVLSWAKLVYEMQDFRGTQAGIDAVSSALRALDSNLVRANAFIATQTSGSGTNPLAGVPLPQVNFSDGSPYSRALNYGVAGDNVDALRVAVGVFALAPSGAPLNAATAFVAQWLRNTDANLVRANAYVSAQNQGQPFTIAELSGTAATTGTGN